MVIHLTPKSARGSMMVELLVAIALLTGALLPIGYSFASEKRMTRAAYHRAAAMEIVDAETEILAAGEWKNFKPGTHEYRVSALAATNLPPGRFLLTVEAKQFSLSWQPASKTVPTVLREIALP